MSRFFVNDSWYFITVPTADHRPYFKRERKRIVLDRIKQAWLKFDINEHDFSIMENHYHLLANFEDASIIPKLLQFINGGAAFYLKQELDIKEKIWGEYHVYIASTEQVLERIQGYVIGNPLKHGEVMNMENLRLYPYSTFDKVEKQMGREYVEEIVGSVIELEEDQFFDLLPKTKRG